ncbi:GntR family transcriptional regulator [Gayadomonas joobiniege]|uniref:GntR family transcriptional regulator n=1 Tax=Gayadomonas joobiniege TaxID=1234606 RepID=UPI000370EB86|nr:GntR family transcriptional regulator [Gayadomonas joobiniege]
MIDKQTEIERIVSVIARAIMQRRLKPGQRLVELQVAESLKANRNHVQAAMQRLALNKYVSIERNKGAFVAKPSSLEAKEVFTGRRVIERGIVELITPEKYHKHKSVIEQHMANEQAAIDGGDRQKIIQALSGFHLMLAQIAENSVLYDMFENILIRSALIVALYQKNDVPACATGEHQSILRALKQGDTGTACDLMQRHLDKLETQLVLDDQSEKPLTLAEALQESC